LGNSVFPISASKYAYIDLTVHRPFPVKPMASAFYPFPLGQWKGVKRCTLMVT